MTEFSPALAALGIGIALAGAPGPVQAVLLIEASRGGLGRGLRALIGASSTFGTILVALALGLSVVTPGPEARRALAAAGGLLLLWLARDAFRAPLLEEDRGSSGRTLPPAARGSLAVALNPGAWLFVAAVASPLIADAGSGAGMPAALLTAIAMMAGAALGDLAIVLIGGLGLARLDARGATIVRRVLAALLGLFGIGLVVSAAIG